MVTTGRNVCRCGLLHRQCLGAGTLKSSAPDLRTCVLHASGKKVGGGGGGGGVPLKKIRVTRLGPKDRGPRRRGLERDTAPRPNGHKQHLYAGIPESPPRDQPRRRRRRRAPSHAPTHGSPAASCFPDPTMPRDNHPGTRRRRGPAAASRRARPRPRPRPPGTRAPRPWRSNAPRRPSGGARPRSWCPICVPSPASTRRPTPRGRQVLHGVDPDDGRGCGRGGRASRPRARRPFRQGAQAAIETRPVVTEAGGGSRGREVDSRRRRRPPAGRRAAGPATGIRSVGLRDVGAAMCPAPLRVPTRFVQEYTLRIRPETSGSRHRAAGSRPGSRPRAVRRRPAVLKGTAGSRTSRRLCLDR